MFPARADANVEAMLTCGRPLESTTGVLAAVTGEAVTTYQRTDRIFSVSRHTTAV